MFVLFGLLFVCLEDVNETFEYFVENAEENVDNLMDSVERVYVWEKYGRTRRSETRRFPPETWKIYTSVLNGDHRMDNVLEGWHCKFQ